MSVRLQGCGVFSGVLDPKDISLLGWERWPWGSTPAGHTDSRGPGGCPSVSQTWRPTHLDVVVSVGLPAPVPSQGTSRTPCPGSSRTGSGQLEWTLTTWFTRVNEE